MRKTRVFLLSIATVVAVMFSLASMTAAAEATESYAKQQFAVDYAADVISETDAHSGPTAAHMERLPESPGGAIAKTTSESKATDNAKASPFGGAGGLAALGIRGPAIA